MGKLSANKWKLLVTILGLVACLGLLVSCGGKDGTRVVFTTGFAKDEVFRIEDESCRTDELMVYLTTIQNQYEGVYGAEIWNTALDGVTLEENVKETVLARIAQVKTMYLLAQEKGVKLSQEEESAVKQASAEYFAGLNETEVAQMGVSPETVEKLYTQYALADKVYEYIIQDINPEISDDEARTITVQHILLRTYTMDGAGKKVIYSDTAKQAVYDKACEIRELAVSGEDDFTELASRYSEDTNITYSFGKGEMDESFAEAAFLLETNEISPVVESESGFHIIKCINTFNREETDANKLEIVEQRRREVFGQEYDAFVDTLARNLNQKLWEELELLHDENVTTDNFFEVYEKYFAKEAE
ncbi:MAG: peptidylprolyl isomerase [Butyrivibrio sp.]|nr:peptidylprolyl isomerase [Muribaculum sp.]MCM1552220.1 peptidylprolyl isomerase [Butyrivibrio sp.]